MEYNRRLYSAETRAGIYALRRSEFDGRYAAYLDRIKRFKAAGNLLDVGCSTGAFMAAAADEGFSVSGVELNADCAAYGRRHYGFDIRSGMFEDAAFSSGSFDVVTMFDVLEHSRDMAAMVSEARRVLRPGGLLVVQSPNLDSVMARVFREDWAWLSPPDHLYHLTPGTMARLLEGGGFRISYSRTWETVRDLLGHIRFRAGAEDFVTRAMRKLVFVPGALLLYLPQKLWCLAGRGGLIEVYATRNDS